MYMYIVAISRKRMSEEKKLSQSLEKYSALQHAHVHRKEEVSTNLSHGNFFPILNKVLENCVFFAVAQEADEGPSSR